MRSSLAVLDPRCVSMANGLAPHRNQNHTRLAVSWSLFSDRSLPNSGFACTYKYAVPPSSAPDRLRRFSTYVSCQLVAFLCETASWTSLAHSDALYCWTSSMALISNPHSRPKDRELSSHSTGLSGSLQSDKRTLLTNDDSGSRHRRCRYSSRRSDKLCW